MKVSTLAGTKPTVARPHKYFIADLHLDGTDTERALNFRAFLKRLSEEAKVQPTELYIIGDLFEFWYEYHPAIHAIYHKDLDALGDAFAAGVAIFLFYGNRDFIYGKFVVDRFGATVLGDGQQITLSDSRPVWLEHGDLLCTGDKSYLRFRRFVRSRPAKFALWLMPWSMARKMIDRVRTKSAQQKKAKPKEAFKVDLDFARQRLEKTHSRVLICGHTHVAQAEDLGAGLRLIVLPPWCNQPAGYMDDGQALIPFTA